MNRREVMTNVAVGIGAWAASGIHVVQAAGNDEKQEKGKPGKALDAMEGDTCPIYPYMFHGTYTSYYALKFMGGNCVAPFSYDSATPLSTGCPGSCFRGLTEEEKKRKVATNCDGSGAVEHNLAVNGGLDPTAEIANTGGNVLNKGDVSIDNPHNPANKIVVRLFEVDVNPASFDPALNAAAYPRKTFHVGHRRKDEKIANPFGTVVSVTKIDAFALCIEMKKNATTRYFTVVLNKTDHP